MGNHKISEIDLSEMKINNPIYDPGLPGKQRIEDGEGKIAGLWVTGVWVEMCIWRWEMKSQVPSGEST